MHSVEPVVVVDGADICATWNRNCVYAWVRGEEYLYVGCSSKVFERIGGHNVMGSVEKFQPADKILIWTFDDWGKAEAFESQMHVWHNPRFSRPKFVSAREIAEVKCQGCGRMFKQTRYWQVWCSRTCRGGSLTVRSA